MRDGFNNRMERELTPESSGQVDELGGMTPEMMVLKNQEWELEPPVFGKIQNKALRQHVQQFCRQPCRIKTTGLGLKSGQGYKAVAKTGEGKKLRASWRRGSVKDRLKPQDYLECNYEEVIRRRNGASHVDLELILPPLAGSKELVSLVYTVPVQMGSTNPEAVVAAAPSSVKLYPSKKSKENSVDLGTAHAKVPMRAGLVDPSWARGRTIFRPGRSVGTL